MQGVTYINQLPDLPELSSGGRGMMMASPEQHATNDPRAGDYGKFIRSSHRPSMMAQGMQDIPVQHTISGAYVSGPGGYLQEAPPPPPPHALDDTWVGELSDDTDYDFDKPLTSASCCEKRECTCREVYDHVNGCNICKAFYMEGRNSVLPWIIVAVQLLVIACLCTKVYDIRVKSSAAKV